jgi:hypothetical protein
MFFTVVLGAMRNLMRGELLALETLSCEQEQRDRIAMFLSA